jgi:hypothetical protein
LSRYVGARVAAVATAPSANSSSLCFSGFARLTIVANGSFRTFECRVSGFASRISPRRTNRNYRRTWTSHPDHRSRTRRVVSQLRLRCAAVQAEELLAMSISKDNELEVAAKVQAKMKEHPYHPFLACAHPSCTTPGRHCAPLCGQQPDHWAHRFCRKCGRLSLPRESHWLSLEETTWECPDCANATATAL